MGIDGSALAETSRAADRGVGMARALPERPPISATPDPRPTRLVASNDAASGQPRLAILGLTLVVPVALLLAVGAGGPDSSVLVLGPIVTFGLPAAAMIAFWWEDWPGTRLRQSWSGWADTLLVAIAAVLLTAMGQTIAGRFDLRGIFVPNPGTGHAPTFPTTMPLAGAAFVAMLELTLVGEGWPLRRLPRMAAGLLALCLAWLIGLFFFFVVADIKAPVGSGLDAHHGLIRGSDLGAALVLVGAWQVLFYVAWRGWPVNLIQRRPTRLLCGHVLVIGTGILSYVLLHAIAHIESPRIIAAAGSVVAAGLVFGMLIEGWLKVYLSPIAERVVTIIAIAALAGALASAFYALARHFSWTRATPDEWVAHVTLNAIAFSVILHVAIGRRWPFATDVSSGEAR
jgi:hypothetical protein